jgi:hypothetical protein
MVSRKGWAGPIILTAGDMLCAECEKGLEVGGMLFGEGRMRDVRLGVRMMGRDEDFITFGRTEGRRVFRRDIASFK